MAKPHLTEIFVLRPVMNKLYDEIHKNVLMNPSAVHTSTANMLKQLKAGVSGGPTLKHGGSIIASNVRMFTKTQSASFNALLCSLSTCCLQEKLAYHRRSRKLLAPGLYLGYLKLCTSVEQIRALVPQKLPNVLCHTKIRDNSNVSRWGWRAPPERCLHTVCAAFLRLCVLVCSSGRSGSGCRLSALWRSPWKWTMKNKALRIACYKTCAAPSKT